MTFFRRYRRDPVLGAIDLTLLILFVIGLASWFVGCGKPTHIEPPNTQQICARLYQCELVVADDLQQCVACLEHVDPEQVKLITAALGGTLPDPKDVPCNEAAIIMTTNMRACVTDRPRWHWGN